MSDNSIAEQIKEKLDLVSYIESTGSHFIGNGAVKKTLCCFHNEKTPSMIVNENFQTFNCYGCGKRGDIITFVMEQDGLSFPDALEKLAELAGVDYTRKSSHSNGKSYTSKVSTLREIMKVSQEFFISRFTSLSDTHPAVQEVTRRGLKKDSFPYGYAPSGNLLMKHLLSKGFDEKDIIESGVCSTFTKDDGTVIKYDTWTDRLIFHIVNTVSQTTGFTGRALNPDDKRKYVNSPSRGLFKKNRDLFNLDSAKPHIMSTGDVYVCEGQFDVIAMSQSGIPQTVASSGTAFTESHAQTLRRMVGEKGRIVFCFDGDEAGKKAARSVFEDNPLIQSQSYAVSFPNGVDPCDFMRQNGEEALKRHVENSTVPLVDFVISLYREMYPYHEGHNADIYLSHVIPVIASVESLGLRDKLIRGESLYTMIPVASLNEMVANGVPVRNHIPVKTEDMRVNDELLALLSDEEKRVVELVESDVYYNISSKILQIVVTQPELSEKLSKKVVIFPPVLKDIAQFFVDKGVPSPFIPEKVPHSNIMKHVTSYNMLPLLSTDEERVTQLDYLLERLWVLERNRYLNNTRLKARELSSQNPSHADEIIVRSLQHEDIIKEKFNSIS